MFLKNYSKSLTVLIVACFVFNIIEYGQVRFLTNYTNLAFEKFRFANIENINIHDDKKIERTIITEDMKKTYEYIVNEIKFLLKDNETFVDFTNQTLLYSLSGKYNPVYVNQSPGFLSGELSQKLFIDEIKKSEKKAVIALLPANEKLPLGLSLDGVMNSFRYYLVAEYLYKNYEPLEIVGDYAIWVKKEKKEELYDKIKMISEVKLAESKYLFVEENEKYLMVNNVIAEIKDREININATGVDPFIYGLEHFVDLSFLPEIDVKNAVIKIEYTSDKQGLTQLFYTDFTQSDFSGEKVVDNICQNQGTMYYPVALSQNSQLRLDIPDGSDFIIKNISLIEKNTVWADYSYGDKNVLHRYYLGAVPYLWGTLDKNKSYNNEDMHIFKINNDNVYSFSTNDIDYENGTYLFLNMDSMQERDCSIAFTNEQGEEKVFYDFKILQGQKNYMIRFTSDFSFYSKEITGFKFLTPMDGININNISLKTAKEEKKD